jgi:predicted DsbA family dithiol-disulfide isomerase
MTVEGDSWQGSGMPTPTPTPTLTPSPTSTPAADKPEGSSSAAAPGYVPSDSAAGEEDPGAAMDLAVERPAPEQAEAHVRGQAPNQPPGASDSQVPILKIDFVSDISCPWCAIGLASLEQALDTLKAEVQAHIHVQPFELNPRMGLGGQDITEHLTQKYGSTPEQQARARDTIRQRGAESGFAFSPEGRGRIYNTFDAHRLLHWAGGEPAGRQLALKKALLNACHRDRRAMDTHEVLLAAVQEVGLDAERARAILQSDAFTDEVRTRERFYTSQGIHSVPAVVINDRHVISGAQPAAAFAQALREIASEGAAP